jgi:DNA-binding response OmpR family regulator
MNIAMMEVALQILIAEDSATQAKQLQHILEKQGYRVTAAANGRLALEAARREKPALVISDVVMPEMNGYELCRRIKSDEQLSDVPVVLVTTLSDPHDVIRGLECRADNFILKPYNAEQLLNRIQFVLVNSRMRRSEQPGMGLEIVFGGQKHFITADRLQILNLLLSTYEAAMQRNHELSTTRDTLRQTNLQLEQLTQELEDRVRVRTGELEHSNEALRQAQQALIQQERLRALGQMASGIAHDINNAISPIALYTESLLDRETTLTESARRKLVTIQRAIDDVAQTVARMREFYRPSETDSQRANVELNSLVQQVIDLTRARWSDQPQRRGVMIELKSALASDLPDIRGVDHEIRDALTNLIFNAVDAMPQVTTKGERGTGLGLAMVYGMAQRHGAALEIQSEPGSGTTMGILFPIGVGAAADTARMPALQVPSRGLRILIVDDDVALNESLRSTLQAEGHEVTSAAGGQEGIEAFQAARLGIAPFDVVITDLGMPYVDGRQVIARVRASAPHTPIILLTGWGKGLDAEGEPPPEVDRVLGKPPRMRELRVALAEVTEGRKAAQ